MIPRQHAVIAPLNHFRRRENEIRRRSLSLARARRQGSHLVSARPSREFFFLIGRRECPMKTGKFLRTRKTHASVVPARLEDEINDETRIRRFGLAQQHLDLDISLNRRRFR